MTGKVYLCGAGCLGADGLTLQAAELIQKADVLVCDDLLDSKIADLNPAVPKIYAGKRKGRHSRTQNEICQLLVELAGKYKNIVRLKGGDPFVFGRAAEEIDMLDANGIQWQVIPGLSSAIAIPELAGIPVTTRNEANSFAVITAQRASDEAFSPDDLKWISAFNGTLVVLMGFSLAETICRQLIRAGWKKDTPAAVVWTAEFGAPEGLLSDLEHLPGRIADSSAAAPAVLVFGKTASRMREKKTAKIRIGLTCSDRFASRLKSRLDPADYEPVSIIQPERIPLDWSFEKVLKQSFDWFSFCSPEQAELFLKECRKSKTDLRHLPRIACIGPATAETFEKAGIYPDLVCSHPGVQNLAEELKAMLPEGCRIASFRSAAGNQILEKELSALAEPVRIDLYGLSYVQKEEPNNLDWLIFASPSSVDNWFQFFDDIPEEANILCLSEVTGSELQKHTNHPYAVPEQVSAESLAFYIQNH
ncbi:MAG: uroporphyrinogen-III C-methyltransferase [Erysipelotrichaceae bacterium]|nr:uroporphyrinogen-III C-methyltransferase [Erysipelotrichaceae bacterium]